MIPDDIGRWAIEAQLLCPNVAFIGFPTPLDAELGS